MLALTLRVAYGKEKKIFFQPFISAIYIALLDVFHDIARYDK